MRIKTILSKFFLNGKISLLIIIASILSTDAAAEYYLVYGPSCTVGCGAVIHHRYHHRRHYRRHHICHIVRRYHYRRPMMPILPTCGYAAACGGCCGGGYVSSGVYFRQPAYYRDYRDYDDYYGAYNNDMRTGDDVAVGMDIDY